MARQQINLLPQGGTAGGSGRLALALTVLGALILVLLLMGGYQSWRARGLQAEQQRLNGQVAELTRRMQQLQQQIEAQRVDPALQQEETRLQRLLARKRRILDLILDERLGNTSGFSAHLEALARSDDDSLWLERVLIEQGGRRILLRGKSLAPDRLPDYIARLGGEPAFAEVAFNYLEVQKGEEGDAWHQWALATEPPEHKERRQEARR